MSQPKKNKPMTEAEKQEIVRDLTQVLNNQLVGAPTSELVAMIMTSMMVTTLYHDDLPAVSTALMLKAKTAATFLDARIPVSSGEVEEAQRVKDLLDKMGLKVGRDFAEERKTGVCTCPACVAERAKGAPPS